MINAADIARYRFTRQELRVCHMLATGRRSAEIACELVVEKQTVFKYEKRVRDKLSAPTRSESAAILKQIGFGKPE